MRNCSLCGFPNQDSVQSCLNCATALEAVCPQCRQLANGGRFCGQCGAVLQPAPAGAHHHPALPWPELPAHTPVALAEKIKTASVRPAGEARDVTILAAQLANLAPAAHHLNPETLYLFIDEAIALLAEIVVQHEGTVGKFTGNGLLAFFGAPVAHEDDSERAIRAALDMQHAIQPLQQRFQQTAAENLPLCLVVHTGPVIAGRMGNNHHMEYTVTGQTVDQAMQLSATATPGVMVSAPTFSLPPCRRLCLTRQRRRLACFRRNTGHPTGKICLPRRGRTPPWWAAPQNWPS
jgi:class 3 adenylate cyclase